MAGKQDPGQDPRRNAGRWRIMLYFNAYVITLARTVLQLYYSKLGSRLYPVQ